MPASAILLDIEGATTPIDFVYDVLFPYARERVPSFLIDHWRSVEIRQDVANLIEENREDRRRGLSPPPLSDRAEEADPNGVTAYIHWLMDADRKTTSLKSLQGRIWEAGYHSGHLQAQIFTDVPPALMRWRDQGKRIAIFSSGSVLAQKLLFSHTEAGDLTGLIDGYFDTNVGAKNQKESYEQIANQLGLTTPEILFISDVTAELDAARAAGCDVLLCIRPGNRPQPNAAAHTTVTSFDEVFP